jgi:hypothetical protein
MADSPWNKRFRVDKLKVSGLQKRKLPPPANTVSATTDTPITLNLAGVHLVHEQGAWRSGIQF